MKIQDMISLDVGLLFIAGDQFCQTGMDFVRVQELAIPGPGCDGAVLAGAHLLFVLVYGASHQEVMELADKLLGQGFHHVVKDTVHAMDVVQHLDHIGDFLIFRVISSYDHQNGHRFIGWQPSVIPR